MLRNFGVISNHRQAWYRGENIRRIRDRQGQRRVTRRIVSTAACGSMAAALQTGDTRMTSGQGNQIQRMMAPLSASGKAKTDNKLATNNKDQLTG